ncbi:MAG: DUF167 domain-containing protein [Patescibacteria group bacterium]|nr:DUF167 domain-containing protein [Patescibacteria group bacterium]
MLLGFKKSLKKEGVIYLRVKARPSAAKTAIREIMADGTIKIDIAAPAEKGRANRELIKFLAGEFGAGKEKGTLVSGAREKLKLIKITK